MMMKKHMMPKMPSCDDGQHRDMGSGAPGADRGQRSTLDRGVKVGHESGGECNMDVPAPPRNALVSTERKA